MVHRDDRVEHYRMITLHKLIRMIHQLKPHILAIDNIHELTRNRRDLISFMRRLPVGTKLVQVTGGEQLESLAKLAHNHGLSFDKFDPIQEAEVCAALASMNVGAEVKVFQDRTNIKVSRARSPGRGGWSQNRYRRKVHGNVRMKVREIEDVLKELNREKHINFTSNIIKGFGGYVRGEFQIDAPRNQIPVNSAKYGDVRIKVYEVERDAIQFRLLSEQKRKYVIVGVDPGTTTGLALLDLKGDLIKLHSSRNISISGVIEMIVKYGRPLIVATDVSPIPGTVEKIRRTFNALPGEPGESLTAVDKINLAKPYGYSNDHERDALAAAAHVIRRYKNKFDQIRKKIPIPVDPDESIALVMRGDTIDSAIAKLTEHETFPEEKVDKKISHQSDERINQFSRTIKCQQETIDNLKIYQQELKSRIKQKDDIIANRNEKIQYLKSKDYKQMRRDKEIKFRENKIRQFQKTIKEKNRKVTALSEHIDKLKQVRNLEISGRTVPIKIVSSFTREAVISLQEKYGINQGDVLFFKNASGGGPAVVDLMFQYGIRAVIFRGELAHNAIDELYKKDLPFFNVTSLHVYYVDDFGVVDPDELEDFEQMFFNDLNKRKKKEKEQQLDNLVEEYKSERRRGLV
ncbi:MAG: DUF460 domain-containing protein [Candidatus Methanomarinus sp.]|uniref:DUF460 domain-containing protein n=1 Tax=Candidatus Methanomarinus sp. TaxID=3386244 RepID=A0AC61SC23_9EURY|nr:MAG: DUF460 domain-containing protein [ANME-2 cluster archaeon]